MAEKDVSEKQLADYSDVFADITNGLIFQGERRVREDELLTTKDKSQYKADGKLHEWERDVSPSRALFYVRKPLILLGLRIFCLSGI